MSDKKEAIRQAAIAVIARKGFHEATTEMIAREAGVAVGTLYNYFQSKDEILSYIFEVEYRKRKAFFERISSNRELGPLEKIEKILRFHFDEMKANPGLAALLVREKTLPRTCHKEGTENFRGLWRFLSEVLENGVKEGGIRAHDPKIVASSLMGAVEGVITAWVLDPMVAQDYVDKGADEILHLLRYGIAKS